MFKNLSGQIYIDGVLRKGTGSDACKGIDPATEEVNGEIVFTSAAEVDEAVAAAKRAQLEWARMSGLARADQLHEVARRYRELAPKLAEALNKGG